jgi:hypothetical protein
MPNIRRSSLIIKSPANKAELRRRTDNGINTVMRDTKSSFRMAGLSARVLKEGIWLTGHVPLFLR